MPREGGGTKGVTEMVVGLPTARWDDTVGAPGFTGWQVGATRRVTTERGPARRSSGGGALAARAGATEIAQASRGRLELQARGGSAARGGGVQA